MGSRSRRRRPQLPQRCAPAVRWERAPRAGQTTACPGIRAGPSGVGSLFDRCAGHNARPMAIPKNVSFVTFDVYGTLIDWETGAFEAFNAEAERDGFTLERDELIALFHEIQQQIEAGSYELYAEVLRRTAVQIAKKLD